MLRYFTCFLLVINSVIASQEIKDSYPFFRQFRSAFNLTFGAASLYKSNQVLQNEESSNKEKDFAKILTLIGLLRITDGTYYMLNKSQPEILIEKGKLDERHPDYKNNLAVARDFEYKLRKYRAAVIFLNGVGFYGIYQENHEKNKLSLYPALGMFIVSTYAFFGKAPSEKVYDQKYGSLTWDINFFKVANKNEFIPYPQMSFYF